MHGSITNGKLAILKRTNRWTVRVSQLAILPKNGLSFWSASIISIFFLTSLDISSVLVNSDKRTGNKWN